MLLFQELSFRNKALVKIDTLVLRNLNPQNSEVSACIINFLLCTTIFAVYSNCFVPFVGETVVSPELTNRYRNLFRSTYLPSSRYCFLIPEQVYPLCQKVLVSAQSRKPGSTVRETMPTSIRLIQKYF